MRKGTPFLSDKLLKDRFDIVSLLKSCTIDRDLLSRLVNGSEFNGQLKDSLARAISDKEAARANVLSQDDLGLINEIAENILEGL